MREPNKSFLVCFWQHDYCAIVEGTDATSAVQGYYDGMDAMCSSPDEVSGEQEPMDVYEIPPSSRVTMARLSTMIENGEYIEYMQRFDELYPHACPIDLGGVRATSRLRLVSSNH